MCNVGGSAQRYILNKIVSLFTLFRLAGRYYKPKDQRVNEGETKDLLRRRDRKGEKGRAYIQEDVGKISGREARDRGRERERGRKRRILSSEGLW